MNLTEWLQIFSGTVFTAAFVPYIIKIIRDPKETPSIVSWFIWASLDGITFTAMFVKHNTNWMIYSAVICAWAVVATIVFTGKAHRTPWDKTDKACAGFGLLAIVCWAMFGDSSFGLFWSLTGTFTAALPTFKRAWRGKEDKLAWAMWTVSCYLLMASFAVAGTLALPFQQMLPIAGQGIVFTLIESIVFSFLFIKPMFNNKPQVLSLE